MRIYRVSHHDSSMGTLLHWERNKHMAKYRRREILKEYSDEPDNFKPDVDIEAVDIPIAKKALVAWLNVYFTTDNG